MGYGETTLEDLILAYREDLHTSEDVIGNSIVYIEDYSSGVKDRLGGVKMITMQRTQQFKGSVVFNPSDEIRQKFGVQEKVACIATFMTWDVTGTKIDKARGRFRIAIASGVTQEYSVSSVNYTGILNSEALHFVIGLGAI